MGKDCEAFNRRLAQLISEKRKVSFGSVMTHIRTRLRFALLRGGVQGNIFGRISFELWALQVPLVIGKTFGEVPGPRRPTVSEPRPAQKLGAK